MCKYTKVLESKLVHLIRKGEVPLVRSTMDSDGNIIVAITKISKHVDYIAIPHVWAGGLGNFKHNWLPKCQLKAIHQDVCNTMQCTYEDSIANLEDKGILKNIIDGRLCRNKQIVLFLNSRTLFSPASRRTKRTTCYYWIDTLCIPVNRKSKRQLAINAMGRIYAGAANVLVLDPALILVNYHDLGEVYGNERANMLVKPRHGWQDVGHFKSTLISHSKSVPYQERGLKQLETCLHSHSGSMPLRCRKSSSPEVAYMNLIQAAEGPI